MQSFDAQPDGASIIADGSCSCTVDAQTAQLACLAAYEAWHAKVVGMDRSCDTPSDCVAVGGTGAQTCDLASHVAYVCAGDAVRFTAYEAVRLEMESLEAEWRAACASVLCGTPGKNCTGGCGAAVLGCADRTCTAAASACAARADGTP